MKLHILGLLCIFWDYYNTIVSIYMHAIRTWCSIVWEGNTKTYMSTICIYSSYWKHCNIIQFRINSDSNNPMLHTYYVFENMEQIKSYHQFLWCMTYYLTIPSFPSVLISLFHDEDEITCRWYNNFTPISILLAWINFNQ